MSVLNKVRGRFAAFLVAMSGLANAQETSRLQETLPALNGTRAPATHAELWESFDPRAEPLEVEILHEWEEEGVLLKVLRFRIGVFKGQKAMLAAIYGIPKNMKRVPGLVQIHGGGQYADYRAPLANAKRGYATISLSWAGRINAPGYKVTPKEVELFWENQTTDPAYRLTTDWGALDAYHAPTRSGLGGFGGTKPSEWTLDPIESPRNDPWFLCALAARRAITFLEKQPEIDKERLGVYGHSMGGRLTVMTSAADPRVKAAVPSCGGISLRSNGVSPNSDDVALAKIKCPILFQSPANDFHGRIDDLKQATDSILSSDWRVSCSPHHNHQDTEAYEVASQLWFDQHLMGTFTFPRTPELAVQLETESGIPTATIQIDESLPVLSVDVFYTRQGVPKDSKNRMENSISRFWHHANADLAKTGQVKTEKAGTVWFAELPLANNEQPLLCYANVLYDLARPVSYAGYYYHVGTSNSVNLSSVMFEATPKELQRAGVKATLGQSLLIESFDDKWEKEWFTYRPNEWGRRTHKVYDSRWQAPPGAGLAFEVRCEQANTLVVGLDEFGAEVSLVGGNEWQSIQLSVQDFSDADEMAMISWGGISELRLLATDILDRSRKLGGPWRGAKPEFRNLRWVP